MLRPTSISWAKFTRNPVRFRDRKTGKKVPWMCAKTSPGCVNCYSEDMSLNRGGRPYTKAEMAKLKPEIDWGVIAEVGREKVLAGSWVFLCSMTDIFGPWLPTGFLRPIWGVIRSRPHVTFIALTKHPDQIARLLPEDWGDGYPNVILSVSVENADWTWRMDVLREIPCRTRMVSFEPLIGPVGEVDLSGFAWAIVGGESGKDPEEKGFRPMDLEWARDIERQCDAAPHEVAFFFKQVAAKKHEQGKDALGYERRELPLIPPDEMEG